MWIWLNGATLLGVLQAIDRDYVIIYIYIYINGFRDVRIKGTDEELKV